MKCDDFFTLIRHVTLWPWPLTPWPWTFVVLPASCVQTLCKMWAKSNNPCYSRFSTLSAVKFYWGPNTRIGLRGAWTELHQTCIGHGAIIVEFKVCFRLQISCCVFKRGPLKVARCWKRCQISHFLTPIKIRGGVCKISGSRIVASPTTEPWVYSW